MKTNPIRKFVAAHGILLMAITVATTNVGCSPPPAAHSQTSSIAETPEKVAAAIGFPHVGFPVLPPRADADPDIRKPRDVFVPTRLLAERSVDRIALEVDKQTMLAESVLVGENMIVGYAFTTNVLFEQKQARTIEQGLTGTPGNSVSYINTKLDGIPMPGEKYTFLRQCTIFETDIPPQHGWSPEGGKYRVLMTRTLRADVEP